MLWKLKSIDLMWIWMLLSERRLALLFSHTDEIMVFVWDRGSPNCVSLLYCGSGYGLAIHYTD